MKRYCGNLTCQSALWLAIFGSTTALHAQAPTAIGGRTIEFVVTGGTGDFVSTGSFRFLPSGRDNTYAIVPVSDNVAASYGNYDYQATDTSTAQLNYNDAKLGPGFVATCTFTTADEGNYVLINSRAPDARQEGTFAVFSAPPPLSIAGSTILFEITSKLGDYSPAGTAWLLPALDGTYRIVGIRIVGNHTGTYSYQVKSPTTAIALLSDGHSPTKQIQQLSFRDAAFGTYYLQNDSNSDFETGTFIYTPAPPSRPKLSAPRLAGNQVQFTFGTEASHSYTVEFTPTLVPAAWKTLIPVPPSNAMTNITVTDPRGSDLRFYRVRAE